MNKPLLGNSDSLQLFPLAYPWAWDMYLENMRNHWMPTEIQVAPDVALWKSDKLTEAERHLFLATMEQLTTFDVQRGDETAESLQGLLDPPELKHYLKRLADEEALHTYSYQFIIENLNLDPNEVYTAYSRIASMRDRVHFANEISVAVKSILAHRIVNPNIELSIPAKQNILLALIFWFLCFEGVWFVMGLSGPIQSMARRGKFVGAAEQFQYILRDEFQHIRFGTLLIKEFMRQHPECLTADFQQAVDKTFISTIRLEEEYMRYCLKGPVLGYSFEDHIETAKWYTSLRLRSIGMDAVYPEARDRLTWRHEMLVGRKEKNFFETRVTEYQTGGALRWDD